MRALLLTLTALLPALPAAAAPAAHRVAEQHVRTDDVRAIALLDGQVLAATGGGLAVHGRDDGAHRFTLTARDGLPGNSLRAVVALAGDTAIVGGDFGAAVVTFGARGPRIAPIDGLGDTAVFAPITVVQGSASPGCATADGPCAVDLLHQHRGRLRAERYESGWRVAPVPEQGHGPWAVAAHGTAGLVRGTFDGRLIVGHHWPFTLPTPVQALQGTAAAVWVATGERLARVVGARLRPVTLGGVELPATALGAAGDEVIVGAIDGRIWRSHGAELAPLATAAGRITAIVADGDGAWLGLAGSGLHRLVAGAVGPALRPAGEICSNHLSRMTRHRGLLVAGTFHRGACALGPDGWIDLPVASPFVFGVASDGHYLWVASSGGIDRFGPDLQPAPFGRGDPRVLPWLDTVAALGAIEVRPGVVAIVSGFGLARIERSAENRLSVRFTGHKDGAPYGVSSITARGDDLVLGSEKHGITVMAGGTTLAARWQDPVHLPENWVMGLDAALDGTVWAATCQSGAAAIDPQGKARRYGVADGLPDRRMTTIAATADGAWLGTLNGLARVCGDAVVAYGVADGLPDPRSAALFVEGDGVWLGTEAGLVYLAPEETAVSAR